MTAKTIEKTDNFRSVIFDPAPTAPEMQALYEKGWVLHMGPFALQGGKYHSAMFFRAVVPIAEPQPDPFRYPQPAGHPQ